MERRIVAQLLSCMDELNGQPDSEKPEPDSTSGVGKDEEEEELMETEKVGIGRTLLCGFSFPS